jgi:hypothetical protein
MELNEFKTIAQTMLQEWQPNVIINKAAIFLSMKNEANYEIAAELDNTIFVGIGDSINDCIADAIKDYEEFGDEPIYFELLDEEY